MIGLSTGTSRHRVTRIAPSIIPSRSSIPKPGLTLIKIECTWRHVKAFLGPYRRQDDYHLHLAYYMFATQGKAKRVSQFTEFLAISASTDCSSFTETATSPSAGRCFTRLHSRQAPGSRYSGMRAQSSIAKLHPTFYKLPLQIPAIHPSHGLLRVPQLCVVHCTALVL